MFFLSNTWACFNRKNMLLLVLFSILLLAGCGNSTAFPLTQFAIPTAESGPDVITVGPDKALWFTEHRARKIGRITVQGQLTEFGDFCISPRNGVLVSGGYAKIPYEWRHVK